MPRKKEFDPDIIVEKAMEIFWQRGYEKTSLQNLVDYLGIGRGSLYATFSNKHTLFLAALDQYSAKRVEKLSTLFETNEFTKSLAMLFHNLINEIVIDKEFRGCFLTNTTTELASHDPVVFKRVKKLHENNLNCLKGAIEKAVQREEISKNNNPHTLALFIVNTLNGLLVMAKKDSKREDLESIADIALSIIK